MKILMLGWELPPHNSGGLGVACFYMAKALAKTGADIDFVVPYSEKHDDINFMKVVNATDFPFSSYMNPYNSFTFSKHHALTSDIRSVQLSYIEFVKKYLEDPKNRPDIIHAHDWLTMEAGIIAKNITGAPLISHIHATEFDRSGGGYGNPQVHDIEYKGITNSDKVFAVSKNTKDIIIKEYKVDEGTIEVVYNAIEPSSLATINDYDDRTFRYIEYLKTKGYTVVMTLTRFTVQKGLTYLLEAFARASQKNPKMALILVGDGEQRNELIEKTAELGISEKVFFTGFLRGERWRDAYSISDVFVMSSVNEPFGLTALEAAHFNNALIISKQSGVSEVLKNILRYDFWDTHKLASHLLAVSTSPSLLRDLKRGVKKEYTTITWSKIAEQIMHEFLSIQSESRKK